MRCIGRMEKILDVRIGVILGFALVMISGIYLSGHSYSIIAGAAVKFVMLIAGFVGCLIIGKPKEPLRLTLPIVMMIAIGLSAFATLLIYRGANTAFDPILLIGIMVFAYMFTRRIPFTSFARLFSGLLFGLTCIAIIVWVLNEANVDIPNYSYVSPSGATYNTIWICTWMQDSNRFMGPFWESGLYASFAVLAILLETCFTGRRARRPFVVVLLIGIGLSMSTAGYLLAVLVLYIAFRKDRKISIVWDMATLIFVIVGFSYSDQLLQLLYSINPDVFWKMVEGGITTSTRIFSPLACLQVFSENPITGLGMSLATEQYNMLKPVFNIDSLTSTSAFMLAAFGILGVTYTIILACAAYRQKARFSPMTCIFIFVLLFLIVNKEPHFNLFFTYVVLFYLCKVDQEQRDYEYPEIPVSKYDSQENSMMVGL